MADTSAQGLGVCLFLIGFTLLAAGVAGSIVILSLLGTAVIGVSCVVFVKAKAKAASEQ